MAILDENFNQVDEANVPFGQVAMKNGLILSAVSIISSLIMFMTGMMAKGFGTIMLFGLLGLIISIFIIRSAIIGHRDNDLGGLISFKRVFILSFLILLISTVIGQIFSFIYLNYINPNTIQEMVEATRTMMEKFNLPEEAVDEAVLKAEADMKNPVKTVTNTLFSAIFGAVVSLIMAAVLKKNPSPFK